MTGFSPQAIEAIRWLRWGRRSHLTNAARRAFIAKEWGDNAADEIDRSSIYDVMAAADTLSPPAADARGGE
jgi:hypothetical protein